ncbi:MAG: endopeptidase La [Gammaproteobacteria bacterium]|nr:MAG: endopeptidase La [Gammaproteobacteria bacterium]
MTENQSFESIQDFPLLPLRDVVVYPSMVVPLFVGRDKSILALEAAMASNKQVLLLAQKTASEDDPGEGDLFAVGTVATVLQMLKLPDGTVKVLVEGTQRATVQTIQREGEYLSATVGLWPDEDKVTADATTVVKAAINQFEQYVQQTKKVPTEVLGALTGIDAPGRLADTMAAHLSLRIDQKQAVLEVRNPLDRIEHVMGLLQGELDVHQVERRIRGRIKKQMEKSQREYYLNEQMKAIQRELGDLDEDQPNELEELEKRLHESGMPKEAADKTRAELNKLKMMSPMSAEASVLRSYLDWMLNIPWKKRSRVAHDLGKAKNTLDTDHYGLDEVKDRILEYLAVQQRVRKIKGPVLCLVGPPGVGKTSLGESIARATNRKFVRMALGGVRDEAEIRGHRRTYIGSLPGKVIQKMSKVGVKNPLFLLDEIDKMGMDHRGDPASALLEVLDPEQNHTFNDHYLEVDYDLSEVMFVCTSNSMNIPAPLLDRMEVIRIPGYTEDEKVNIALRYLVPKQMKNSGLRKDELAFTEEGIRHLIRYYTRESGVRGLERAIAKICRKVVKESLLSKGQSALITITPEQVEQYSGVRKFSYGRAQDKNQIGQVTGLAWTQVGGELLTIEATAVPGKGRIIKTGSLGDVMQESIQAALTVVRSRAQVLGIPGNFHEKYDLHVHVPEGATPKDGPSAGIGMCTALVSVFTGIPVRSDVAMTGEITLRGEVLPIGGLKEKLLAAHRGGIGCVVIPKENERDLKEIPDNIKESLEIHTAQWIDEVLAVALEKMPQPLSDEEFKALSTPTKGGDSPEDRVSTH